MMNHSPSQDGSASDQAFAGRYLSFSLSMNSLSEPWPMASTQDGPDLRLRFEATDSSPSPLTSATRLDWTGGRALSPGSGLHPSAASAGLIAGGITKLRGEDVTLLGINPLLAANTLGKGS